MPKTPAEQNAELANDLHAFATKFDESGRDAVPATPPAAQPAPEPPKPAVAPAPAPAKPSEAPAGVKPADKAPATPEPPPGAKLAGEKPPGEADIKVDWDKLEAPRTPKDWKNFKAKRAEEWQRFQATLQERDKKIQEQDAKLKEFEAKPAPEPTESLPTDKAEIERLTGEVKALTEKITILDVTQHPDFIRHFQGRTDAVISEAKELVGADKAAAVEAILKIQDPDYQRAKLGEFLNDIEDEVVRDGVIGAMRDLRKIGKERQAEIARAEQHKGTLMAKSAERATALQKELETAYGKMLKAIQDPKTGHPAFQLRADNPEWNAGVAKRVQAVQDKLLGKNMTAEGVAFAAALSEAEPLVRQAYAADLRAWKEEKAALVADYEAKLAALKAAQPTAGAGVEAETRPETIEDVPIKDQARWAARKIVQGL